MVAVVVSAPAMVVTNVQGEGDDHADEQHEEQHEDEEPPGRCSVIATRSEKRLMGRRSSPTAW